MKKTIHTLLVASAMFVGVFTFTGCDVDDVAGFAVSETGGEYIVTDQIRHTPNDNNTKIN